MKANRLIHRFISVILILVMNLLYFPVPAQAATMSIRQEINILNGYLGATSGNYATSSEMINIDPNWYTGATYYFEVVASTTSATNATFTLRNATSITTLASVTVNGTSYARYRSTSFSPPPFPADYVVTVGNESVGKGAIVARVVILQSADPIHATQTQIDIGNRETYTSTATSTFSSPKYWYYDSTKWDGTPMFYAEVVYQSLGISATTTIAFATVATTTWTAPPLTTVAEVGAWGGGGAGFTGNTGGGGAGGGGGAFASSTVQVVGGQSYQVVVGGGGTTSGAGGATTTFNGTTVVAASGGGGKSVTTLFGLGGLATLSTGTKKNNGGNGGQGANGSGNNDQAGGGGGAGGPHGAGGTGGNASTSVGGGGGGGNGGNNGGTPTAGTSTSGGDGGVGGNGGACANGVSDTRGGGGGGGADNGLSGCSGGTYGAGGGGGESAMGSGADGAVVISYRYAPATTTITLQESDGTGDGFTGWTDKVQIVTQNDSGVSAPTRVRSLGFIPVSGRNYRIVFRNNYSGINQNIYSAKIIVQQSKGWDISTGLYASKSFLVSGQEINPNGVAFSTDGKKMYIVGTTQDTVFQYTLGTAWDILTASYDTVSFSVSSQDGTPSDIEFSYDGSIMYILGTANDTIYQYNLSSPWVVSSASYASKSLSVNAQESSPWGLYFSVDGRNAYVNGNNDITFQYILSIPWDVSTGFYSGKSLNGTAQAAGAEDIFFSTDGSIAYIVGDSNNTVFQYSLTKPWDVSTGSYTNKSMSVSAQESGTSSFWMSPDGSKGYIVGYTNDTVYQYTISGTDVTKLQPQYLLGNTLLKSGTGLQNFLTSWDSSEWNTTNAYYHQVSASNNSTSVVLLNTSGGTLVTNSTVTSPDNMATSTSLCMPANGNLDVKATTNNNDVYSSRILVDVGGEVAICEVVTSSPRIIRLRGNIRLRDGVRLR